MSILLTYQGQIWGKKKKTLKTTQLKSESIKEKAKAKVPKFSLSEWQWICKGASEPCNYIKKTTTIDILTVKCIKSHSLPFIITMNNHIFAVSFLLFLLLGTWHVTGKLISQVGFLNACNYKTAVTLEEEFIRWSLFIPRS